EADPTLAARPEPAHPGRGPCGARTFSIGWRQPVTTRVFECGTPSSLAKLSPPAVRADAPRAPGFKRAALAAAVLVPLAGAAEPPQGWAVAAATAVVTLVLVRIVGDRAHWGWLAVLFGVAGLVTPRGQLAELGP